MQDWAWPLASLEITRAQLQTPITLWAAVQKEPGQDAKASNIRSWYLITNWGVWFLQEEGQEICGGNEGRTDWHVKGMDGGLTASASGAGEEQGSG